MLFVTIFSVGYGDFYPSTYQGRVISVLVAVIGTFLIAVLIRVMHESIALRENEVKCLRFVKGNQIKNEQREAIIVLF